MPPETSTLNGLYLVLHGYGPIQIEQLSYVSVIKDKSFKLWRKATVYFHSGQDFGLAFTRVSIFGLIYWFADYLFKAFKQSHYREVPRWEIFMEQELRFGPVGITEEKNLGQHFHVFMGKKKFKKKHCNFRT